MSRIYLNEEWKFTPEFQEKLCNKELLKTLNSENIYIENILNVFKIIIFSDLLPFKCY